MDEVCRLIGKLDYGELLDLRQIAKRKAKYFEHYRDFNDESSEYNQFAHLFIEELNKELNAEYYCEFSTPQKIYERIPSHFSWYPADPEKQCAFNGEFCNGDVYKFALDENIICCKEHEEDMFRHVSSSIDVLIRQMRHAFNYRRGKIMEKDIWINGIINCDFLEGSKCGKCGSRECLLFNRRNYDVVRCKNCLNK